jgi:uncharacterized protein (DUF2126 family)
MTDTAASHLLHHELLETYENIRHWSDSARTLEAEAAEAHRLARLLDTELTDMRTVLHPVRAHHTSATWQGRAADRSRHRLDLHEDEHHAAIRHIDALVDDLLARASSVTAAAHIARDALDAARHHAASIETEFDGARHS